MQTELVFDLSELKHIWFECPGCHSEFLLSAAEPKSKPPLKCAVCDQEWPKPFVQNLRQLEALLQNLQGFKVRVHVKEAEG